MINVVLVDKKGKERGTMERLAAHKRPGILHKAISIVLYRTIENPNFKFPHYAKASWGRQETNNGSNSNNQNNKRIEILLQKRAATKPLWPLYWANTVCTHPLPGEANLDCAVRRLREEMGIEIEKGKLTELYAFYYQADYDQELSEHEHDTVIVGEYNGGYELNPEEVAEAKWVEWKELKEDLERHPEVYAPWPKMIFRSQEVKDWMGKL